MLFKIQIFNTFINYNKKNKDKYLTIFSKKWLRYTFFKIKIYVTI